MATGVKERLRTAALAYGPLSALIGTNWYDNQLPQPVDLSVLPAITVLQVSAPRQYILAGRLATAWWRFQFTLWGGQNSAGAVMRGTLRDTMLDFIASVNLYGVQNIPAFASYIAGDRDALFPYTDGPIYQQLIDGVFFVNETL